MTNLHIQSKGLTRKVLNAYWLLLPDYCKMLEDKGELRKEQLKQKDIGPYLYENSQHYQTARMPKLRLAVNQYLKSLDLEEKSRIDYKISS